MLGFHDCSLRAARSAVGVADKVRIIWDPERETRIGKMGQPQSSEEGSRQSSGQQREEESVPYTRVSREAPSASDRGRGRKSPPSTVKGITVVNPKPDRDIRRARPLELQKLDKIHRFWPILKSSVQYNNPVEKVSDGLEYRDLLGMCARYQSHLRDTAAIVAVDQRALTSRLKDLEMFSAGITQQLIRRQERMQRALVQLEKVKEVTNTLEEIESSIEQILPMLRRLNQLLPDSDRLEPFHLKEIEEGEGRGEGERGDQTVDDGVVSIDDTLS